MAVFLRSFAAAVRRGGVGLICLHYTKYPRLFQVFPQAIPKIHKGFISLEYSTAGIQIGVLL